MLYLVAQSCLTLCNPTDCSPPGFSIHRILQTRILEWITIAFSRETSQPRNQTLVSCMAGRFFTIWATVMVNNFALELREKSSTQWISLFKKVCKTTRPFRYDLNQIPYDYTVEVRNRLKGLDLIDRVPEELQAELHDFVQEAVMRSRPSSRKRNAKRQ